MIFLLLFYEFFKTGLFAIGGGLATLPFLYDMSERMGWFSSADIADMIAISESTPGAIGINMATYAGFRTAGIPGSIIATLGLVTPSIIVILLIAGFLKNYYNNKHLQSAFYGLRPASAALIASACYGIIRIALLTPDRFAVTGNILDLFQYKALILAALLLVATHIKGLKKVHPILYIAVSAVVGIVFKF